MTTLTVEVVFLDDVFPARIEKCVKSNILNERIQQVIEGEIEVTLSKITSTWEGRNQVDRELKVIQTKLKDYLFYLRVSLADHLSCYRRDDEISIVLDLERQIAACEALLGSRIGFVQ